MENYRHGSVHYFYIGTDKFYCTYDANVKMKAYWHTPAFTPEAIVFGFSVSKHFSTKEKCEEHIRSCIKRTCKNLLKGLGGKMINAKGGYNKKV